MPSVPDSSGDEVEQPIKRARTKKALFMTTLAALGVIYGDLATSPLYTLGNILGAQDTVGADDIIGATSALIWALILVVTIKYVVFVLRADYRGEGGTFSLLRLLLSRKSSLPKHAPKIFEVLTVVMASAILADGVVTPAISVTSAIGGLVVINPSLSDIVVPVSIGIIVLLFLVQSLGTASIGTLFGPVMALWLIVIAVLGIYCIGTNGPGILLALSPHPAILYFARNGALSLHLAGSVVLALTGAEAMYADLGHFDLLSVRLSWLALSFPCVILQYLGQGAFLLANNTPFNIANFFYVAVPPSLLIPMTVLATLATIIASQAVITGSFTVVAEAVTLNFLPRVSVRHTSMDQHGQIYVCEVNYLLMAGCVGVVLGFKTSAAMTNMFGVAVSTVMLLTSLLLMCIMKYVWRWRWWMIALYALTIGVIDAFMWIGNILKIADGGYVSLGIAFLFAGFMLFWTHGQHCMEMATRNDIKNLLRHYEKLPRSSDSESGTLCSTLQSSTGGAGVRLHSERTTPVKNAAVAASGGDAAHNWQALPTTSPNGTPLRDRGSNKEYSNSVNTVINSVESPRKDVAAAKAALDSPGRVSHAARELSYESLSEHDEPEGHDRISKLEDADADPDQKKLLELFVELVETNLVPNSAGKGTVGIFVTHQTEMMPLPFQRLIAQFTRAVPAERVVFLTVKNVERPTVPDDVRFVTNELASPWLYKVVARIGFAEVENVAFLYDKFIQLVLPKLYGVRAGDMNDDHTQLCCACPCSPRHAYASPSKALAAMAGIPDAVVTRSRQSMFDTNASNSEVVIPTVEDLDLGVHDDSKHAFLCFYVAHEFVFSAPERNFFHRFWVSVYDFILRNARSQTHYLNLPCNKVIEVGAAVRI